MFTTIRIMHKASCDVDKTSIVAAAKQHIGDKDVCSVILLWHRNAKECFSRMFHFTNCRRGIVMPRGNTMSSQYLTKRSIFCYQLERLEEESWLLGIQPFDVYFKDTYRLISGDCTLHIYRSTRRFILWNIYSFQISNLLVFSQNRIDKL